ncbi:outer membrane beta-barrel protein, partial [Helicobacter suis]|uniref:outer membrane beta-barrel protein n=1 Tax=Helicobacter suis TaxID=104628 RepID=UPI00249192BE
MYWYPCLYPSGCSPPASPQISQLQQDIKTLITTAYNVLNNDISGFLSNSLTRSSVISQSQFENAKKKADDEINGISTDSSKKVKACTLTTSSGISSCFSTLRSDMFGNKAPNGVSVVQLAEVYEWFSKVGSQVLASNNTDLELELLKIYNDYNDSIRTAHNTSNYHLSVPALKTVQPTAPTLNLTYNSQASTITADQSKANQQHNLTPMQALISLAPLSNTINSLSRPFGNVNWNASIGVGYQYFFSRHFGFDAYINTEYSYLNSPLLKRLDNFKALQGVSWGIGADFIYDMLVAKGKQKWFAGLFAGIAGAGNYYYLDMKETPLARTRGYNVLFNWGLRFQRSHNIFKIGVKNPLITRNLSMQANNTKVILNKTAKSANIYISYAYL